jgi:hypothetical protein
LGSQGVIDRSGLDLARPGGRSQQKEREAVRPAGNGNSDPGPGWNEPVKIGRKTADQRRIRSNWRRSCPW